MRERGAREWHEVLFFLWSADITPALSGATSRSLLNWKTQMPRERHPAAPPIRSGCKGAERTPHPLIWSLRKKPASQQAGGQAAPRGIRKPHLLHSSSLTTNHEGPGWAGVTGRVARSWVLENRHTLLRQRFCTLNNMTTTREPKHTGGQAHSQNLRGNWFEAVIFEFLVWSFIYKHTGHSMCSLCPKDSQK